MRSQPRKSARKRRGAAAVEFAFVAPVFITILMGVAEASHLFEAQNQLAVAVREGLAWRRWIEMECWQTGKPPTRKSPTTSKTI